MLEVIIAEMLQFKIILCEIVVDIYQSVYNQYLITFGASDLIVHLLID